jgi:hypothetical protein
LDFRRQNSIGQSDFQINLKSYIRFLNILEISVEIIADMITLKKYSRKNGLKQK